MSGPFFFFSFRKAQPPRKNPRGETFRGLNFLNFHARGGKKKQNFFQEFSGGERKGGAWENWVFGRGGDSKNSGLYKGF